MGMIDHIGLSVADYERSKAFYLAALAPLGYELFMEFPAAGPHAGFGANGKPDFWITKGKATTPQVHVAFGARDRATVRAFYDAALAAGATDNGPPGLRRNITRTTTAPSCSIPTAITSRRSATTRSELSAKGWPSGDAGRMSTLTARSC
jgi:catechol 2,3-dioxygenase-like lactoylglutathione lyase family enzyme